jgi:hypothetical protein
MTLIPWQNGKTLTWDVTVATTLAESYITSTAISAGAAAEQAATRKCVKYADLPASYLFQPLAFETLGTMNSTAAVFLSDLGRRTAISSGDDRDTAFLFQRLSVTLQRFNAILLHDSFDDEHGDPDL